MRIPKGWDLAGQYGAPTTETCQDKRFVPVRPNRLAAPLLILEKRKLNKADKALYYWLKVLANSIYGFFGELNRDTLSKKVQVTVFSGQKKLSDASNVIENPGPWFFPPSASLITSGGRLLLAMAEACAHKKQGSYLFCDTDSLAVVASKRGGTLRIPWCG